MYICTHTCVHTCMCACIYVYIHKYIYIYTHRKRPPSSVNFHQLLGRGKFPAARVQPWFELSQNLPSLSATLLLRSIYTPCAKSRRNVQIAVRFEILDAGKALIKANDYLVDRTWGFGMVQYKKKLEPWGVPIIRIIVYWGLSWGPCFWNLPYRDYS